MSNAEYLRALADGYENNVGVAAKDVYHRLRAIADSFNEMIAACERANEVLDSDWSEHKKDLHVAIARARVAL